MEYNNIYKLNFARLAVLLLPVMLRKPVLVAYLRAIFSQFELIPFLSYRQTTNYRLTHNGQICYLRAVLNDRFDPDVGESPEDKRRRIEIGDGTAPAHTLVYWREKKILVGVPARGNGALLIGWRGTATGGGADFTVRVPLDVWEDAEKMAVMLALIREYKLASKQFIITVL